MEPRIKKRVIIILLLITLSEGTWVVMNLWFNGKGFIRYLGFGNSSIPMWGWVSAIAVAVFYIIQGRRLPSVREYFIKVSGLKFLAFLMAVVSSILEEVFFRQVLMEAAEEHGLAIISQILLSGIVFGALHGVWGLFGKSLKAALSATIATGILGMGLATVYILSGRIVLPCIASHFAINLLLEPGLIIAAVKGEMGKYLRK